MCLTRIALKAVGGLIGFLAGAFAFIHRLAGRFSAWAALYAARWEITIA